MSGSTPPLAFINPLVFLFLGALYGSGALLVRDYARRWHRGWRSVLLLGAAYGIIEEGILVRSFFNPGWKDLGLLSSYGRWLGVNWVWAEWLTIYHAIFSIAIPIFLVEKTWPETSKKAWLTPKSRILFHILLVGSIIAGFFAFPYDAPVLGLAGCVGAVFLLGWVAKRLPNITKLSGNLKVRWRTLVPFGASAPAAFFFLFNSAIIPFAIGTMILGGLLVLAYERLLRKWSRTGLNDYQKLGLVAGAAGFFAVFFDFILEFAGPRGTIIVGALFTIFLYRLRKQVRIQAIHAAFLESSLPQVRKPEPDLR
ncbi:MAG TPA: hypothetical protein VFE98_05465 [Candidatus Bathyarchaeia archaeon]|nr:hypothetical protein [Candidatus Bathyarchaeia archaeon]